MTRKLTQAAQAKREEWKDMPKCTRGMFCMCNSCLHDGNPMRQAGNTECWEDDAEPVPPRGRMKDWVQT